MDTYYISVDDRIHFVIFYKKLVRQFLRYFWKKYSKIRQFRESFVIEKDFNLLIKEEHKLELKKGRKNQTNSNLYALQSYFNVIQTKL